MKAAVRKFNKTLDSLIPSFRREIAKEKNRFIRASIAGYKQSGQLQEQYLFEHEAKMLAIFSKHYKKIFKKSVEMSAALAPELKAAIPDWSIKADDYEDYLREWYLGGAKDNVFEIATTTQKDMRRLMRRAFEAELAETDVIKAGMRAMGLTAYRADTIARTETHKAAMFASKRSIQTFSDELGIEMLKEWNAAQDERTRIDHAEADGATARMDEPFNVGGEQMDRPADPSASPENVISCRCVLTYRRA